MDFLHDLLADPVREEVRLEGLLQDLARVFCSDGAGVAGPLPGTPLLQHRVRVDGPASPLPPVPWLEHPDLLQPPANPLEARALHGTSGPGILSAVLAQPGSSWLLWIEDSARRDWTSSERAALVLAAQVLARWLSAETTARVGTVAMDRVRLHQRLEDAGRIASRLAHDFDNVLTGVLGFGELMVQHVPATSPARRFLAEQMRAAERGTEMTQRLRQFGRGQDPHLRPGSLAEVLAEEQARLGKALPIGGTVQWAVPADSPLSKTEAGPLRLVLRHLLDNAVEALRPGGSIAVSAGRRELSWVDCLECLGNLQPGPHLTLRIADTGCGLSPEARQRIVAEPFFTTKPGHRGLGLVTVYRVLFNYRSGLRIGPGADGGVVAEVFYPLTTPTTGYQT